MRYNTDLYLCQLRKLVSTELIKSGTMTVILGIAGFFLGTLVMMTGKLASPMLIAAMAVTTCAVLYAASTIRLMLALRRTDPDKIQYITSTDQLRYVCGTMSSLLPMFTAGTKRKAYSLETEIDVALTRKIEKETDPFEVKCNGT